MSHKLEWLKLRLIYAAILGELLVQTVRAPWWWLRRRTGHAEAVDRDVERIANAWAGRMLRLFHCEVRVEGLEHLPKTGPVIIAANHQSMYDIPTCMGYLGRLMGFVAKKELFRIPGFAYWMRQIHCASIDRGDVTGGAKLLEDLSRMIKERGYCMIIFPEGTRSRHPDAEIGPFRRGALRIATAQGIPIVPLSIDGTRFLVSPAHMHATRNGGRIVRMKLAPARVPNPDASAPELKRFMDDLRETIVSNRNAIRVHWPSA
ncbi:MAG TPA: lysophospholipid acyltransferase family protein [bacterium]